jgi:hypothetical protein
VTNAHGAGAPAPVTWTASAGEGNRLVLSGDATNVSFSDVAPMLPVVAGLDQTDECLPSGDTATCPAAPLTIALGDGNDTVAVGAGLPDADIDGGDGTDQVDLSGRTDPVTVDLGGTLSSGMSLHAIENATGGSNNDQLNGDGLANKESGGDGDDTLNGAGGEDTLNGGNGIDVLDGGTGVNNLRGGAGDDTLNAGGEGDLLVGGPGLDHINGGVGDDDIVAADGVADFVSCGGGADTVVADLGANGIFDQIDPNCQTATVTGSVAVLPDPPTTPAPTETTTITPVIVVPAAGKPALVPVLAPGKANFADLTPPSASMRSFSRQRLKTVVTRGVPVRVSCQEACGISVAISVNRTTARRLKLDARVSPVIIGTALAQRVSAGTSQLRVKFTKRTRAAIRKSKRSFLTTTQVLVSDASGNGTLLTRQVTLVP